MESLLSFSFPVRGLAFVSDLTSGPIDASFLMHQHALHAARVGGGRAALLATRLSSAHHAAALRRAGGPTAAAVSIVDAHVCVERWREARREAGVASGAGSGDSPAVSLARELLAVCAVAGGAPTWVGVEDTQGLFELVGGLHEGWETVQALVAHAAATGTLLTIRIAPGCDWRVPLGPHLSAASTYSLSRSLSGALATLSSVVCTVASLPSGFTRDVHGRLTVTPRAAFQRLEGKGVGHSEDETHLSPAASIAASRSMLFRVGHEGRVTGVGDLVLGGGDAKPPLSMQRAAPNDGDDDLRRVRRDNDLVTPTMPEALFFGDVDD